MASESDLDGTSLSYIELVGISRDPSGLILLFFLFLLNFCRGLKALAAEYMHIHKYIKYTCIICFVCFANVSKMCW